MQEDTIYPATKMNDIFRQNKVTSLNRVSIQDDLFSAYILGEGECTRDIAAFQLSVVLTAAD